MWKCPDITEGYFKGYEESILREDTGHLVQRVFHLTAFKLMQLQRRQLSAILPNE